MVGKITMWVAVMIMAASLSGCKTTKVVSDMRQSDTIVAVQIVHDSIKVVQVRRDSTYVRDSIFVMADTSGKVTYKELWHTKYIYKERADSSSYWRARLDSVCKASARVSITTKEVESPLWKRRFYTLVLVLTFVFVIWAWLRRR